MAVNETTLKRRAEKLALPAPDASVSDRVRYLITRMRKTQQQFADLIDVDSPNLSRILNGRAPFTDSMINRIVVNLGVSKDWLVNGTDVPFSKSVNTHPELIVNEDDDRPRVLSNDGEGAPVYDIDCTAGYDELSEMFTTDRIIGYLKLPQINPRNAVVRVSGESMLPDIPNGAFISIRPISNDAPIFWGQTYLVVLEDYRMVKILRRHPDSSKVILHSLNPKYDDMEINRDLIKGLYIVDAVLNFSMLA